MIVDGYEHDRLLKWAIAEGRGNTTEAIQLDGLKALLHVKRRQMKSRPISLLRACVDTPFYRSPTGTLNSAFSAVIQDAVNKAVSVVRPAGQVWTGADLEQIDASAIAKALKAYLPKRDDTQYFSKAKIAEKDKSDAPRLCAYFLETILRVNADLGKVDVTDTSLTLDQMKLYITQQYAVDVFLCGTLSDHTHGIKTYDPLVFAVDQYLVFALALASSRIEFTELSLATNLSNVYKDPEAYISLLAPSAIP